MNNTQKKDWNPKNYSSYLYGLSHLVSRPERNTGKMLPGTWN